MSPHPILLLGGAGIVGRHATQQLRAAPSHVPLLIGCRDIARAEKAAADAGSAEGIEIDLRADDLGLGGRLVSAVALLFTDTRIAGLRCAQRRGIPHISISPGIVELGPEVAAFINSPNATPVVLRTEWLVGGTSIPTLKIAKSFARFDKIAIGALLDEQDAFGPAAEVDLERQTRTMPAALARRDGVYVWRVDGDARTRFHAVDGTLMDATALSPNDLLGLASATGAPNVEFNLALGMSSARRSGQPLSAEIFIQIAGTDHSSQPLRTPHAVVHPGGQMALTGLGVAMVLERLVGLDGKPPTPSGLYFPYQLLDSAAYLDRLHRTGGKIPELEVL
ncbi:NAD(P)-dependent oxidoreductase [Paracoccus liaowanqingii]|uniref:NAD(P)-dependent oxidoreductase n=1 Tax=Paracoccus liaowanqingii TaxID=2560053 RepID=A0A4Z1CKZ4_9RHOB|nr:NAD(P)-dependent oxidoreductase [Paracoccus liaowanqingii]TGN55948.1 NAD(P)-dependent oxidoreductase [Paracoccus liaowanqingii]